MNTRSSSRLAHPASGILPLFFLEPLEERIAPATLVNPTLVTYQDLDGDLVKVKISKPVFDEAKINDVFKFDTGNVAGDNTVKQQLQQLSLAALTDMAAAAGANLTISAAKRPGGDGSVNVGSINADGVDLGQVSIQGDLGQIHVGDATTDTPGLISLNVRSLGRYGLATQGGAGDLDSVIKGALGVLKVAGDVKEASISLNSKLGLVAIGGSLLGGQISASAMGSVKIRGDVVGGAGDSSGAIISVSLTKVSVGGSVLGGPGAGSGRIFSIGDMGSVDIRGDIVGGVGPGSGRIQSAGNITKVAVGGSVVGGMAILSGGISGDDIGLVKIGRDLRGGSLSATATDNLDESGCIEGDRVGGVVIGGSIIAGRDDHPTFTLSRSGAIIARELGPLAIKGSLMGNETNPVSITARGQATPGTAGDVAIAKITVGGRVERAQILAGYDISKPPAPINADASIGPVSVGGDWIASNLVAGVLNLGTDDAVGGVGAAADNVNFGDSHDRLITSSDDPNLISRIAKITIKGLVIGTGADADHFGFVAQQIGAFKVGGFTLPLISGNDVVELSPLTGDFTLREPA
jgi:hypothetical protein